MAEKLLNLINGHISRLEQYRGNRMPKQMWIDAFGNSGCPCMLFDNALHASYRIRVFWTKTAKSQLVSKNSDLSPAPRRPYRGLPPIY